MKKLSILEEKISELWNKLQQSQVFVSFERQLDQFDPRIQTITMISVALIFSFIVLSPVLILISSVSTKKEELQKVKEITDYLSQSADEISQLNTIIRKKGKKVKRKIDLDASLLDILENSFRHAQIIKERYKINSSSSSTASSNLKLISLPQLLNALYNIEGSNIEITKLDIDTKNDPEGYVWAKIDMKKPIQESKEETKKKSRRYKR